MFFWLTTWTSVSAVIVAVTVLPVQVMDPSGPTSREQLDGQPVVPGKFEDAILVEFAKVAALISPCLWYQYAVRKPTRVWDCGRYAERYGNNETAG